MRKKIIIPISLILVLSVVIILIALGVFRNYSVYKDVKYGEHDRNTLDLYIPKNYKENGLILYIHGGAWIAGDKDTYKKTLRERARSGIACASINYRYASESVSCLDILEDITKAVSKIKEVASENGVTLNKMILTGHSAGAHLSLLYAYKCKEEAAIEPVAVVSFAGPTDLTDELYYNNWDGGYTIFSYMIGKNFDKDSFDSVKDDLLNISPVTYVSTSVPTIIAQGEVDEIVPLKNGKDLENKLKEEERVYFAYYYPTSGHGLEKDKDINKQVYDKFNDFILEYLKKD